MDTKKVREEYIENLKQILMLPDEKEKNKSFQQLYVLYEKFCCDQHLPVYDYDLFEESDSLFVLDTMPIDYTIDEEKKQEAIEHLEVVLENNRKGYRDGITEEEVTILLESTIQNARIALANQEKERDLFFKASLTGACGYSQALTAFPLLELGVPITINNARNIPDCPYSHAFLTATFPIKEDDKVVEKQYLLDATYRQFFRTIYCNEGVLYDKKRPADVGYYLLESEEGKEFAEELLGKGYIELTDENARLYGYGFSCTSLKSNTPQEEKERIQSHTGKEYKESIFNRQEELDYEREEFLDDHTNISLKNPIPSILSYPQEIKSQQK